MARCLLIDDDGRESRRVAALLGGLGLDTARAAAPDEALRYMTAHAPDVVMLAAGGERPRDFVRRLRRAAGGKKPAVFLYAARPDTDLIGRSILQGAADVLIEPFDRDLLRFKLQQAGVLA
jgi:CheY-like chemotaxis protein